jgi:hypothetical protein
LLDLHCGVTFMVHTADWASNVACTAANAGPKFLGPFNGQAKDHGDLIRLDTFREVELESLALRFWPVVDGGHTT